MHTKHRMEFLQLETTLAVLGDHGRYRNGDIGSDGRV